MCGIAGYLGKEEPGRLEAMLAKMVHRGPDGQGQHDEQGVHLGMRRLAIIDLETGNQPQYDETKQIAVLFNGEIYNHVELRKEMEAKGREFTTNHSDTEVLVQLYADQGISMVDRLVGMFAVSIYDRRTGELFLIRDRLGKKPIFYRDAPGDFSYASEINSLGLGDREAHVNKDALAWYFSQKTVPPTESIDERVKKIPAGAYLRRTKDGKIELKTYWQIAGGRVAAPETDADLIDRVEAQIKDAVKLRMRADVEVGAFLSGGVDSSLVCALASKLTDKPLKTWCLVYDEEINHKASDRKFAKLMSEQLGTKHTEVLLTPELLRETLPRIVAHHGQPNSAVLSNWFISREMGKVVKVALSGDGADELFGSYRLHRTAAAGEGPVNIIDLIDEQAVFTSTEIQQLLGRPSRPMLERRAQTLNLTGRLDRALEWDCRGLLCDQVLNYSDLLSMAHSLEVRTPFLDHRLVDLAFSLPPRAKIRDGETKWVLKQVAKRYLPAELVTRPKEGFVEPAVYWIGKQLKDFTADHLLSEKFNRLGLLNKEWAQALVKKFLAAPDFNNGKKVWNLLVYAIWEAGLAG